MAIVSIMVTSAHSPICLANPLDLLTQHRSADRSAEERQEAVVCPYFPDTFQGKMDQGKRSNCIRGAGAGAAMRTVTPRRYSARLKNPI